MPTPNTAAGQLFALFTSMCGVFMIVGRHVADDEFSLHLPSARKCQSDLQMDAQIKGALSGRTAEGWGEMEGICEQEMQMPTDVMDHKT